MKNIQQVNEYARLTLYKNRFSYKSVSCTILKKTVTATLHDIDNFRFKHNSIAHTQPN